MDHTLRQAIGYLLGQIDDVVEDLLLVEVDWGEGTPEATNAATEIDFQGARWPMVYADSELVLRRVLCRAGPGGKAILVLRGEEGFQVPLDVRARAHRGIVFRLGLRHRLHALTGRDWPPEVDYAEWRPSIARHLDALVSYADGAAPMRAVTRGDLEEILVRAAFGVTVRGNDAPQLLAALVSAQRRSPDPPTGLERSLLQGQLRLHQVRQAGVLLWAAGEVGRAEAVVRAGVMMGAERAAGLSPGWGELHGLRALLVSERQLAEGDAFEVVIGLGAAALPHLHPSTRQAIVRAAEATLQGVLPPDRYNPWFPAALEGEIERLARRLALHDVDAVAQIARLRDHLFADRCRPQLSILDEMSGLVVGWHREAAQTSALGDVSGWAAWYADHGAGMDLTALKLMHGRHQATGLSDSIARLLQRYWRWRDALNASFAGQFVGHYEAALHDRDGRVFGTHRLLDWVVRPRLQAGKRVLLVIVDGMGYAAFLHLRDPWAEGTPPVYVRPHQGGSFVPRAVLSLLPSVTSVSRKAIFLKALPTDRLDDEETYQEKARTGETQALQAAFPDRAVRLYYKANLGDGRPLLDDVQLNGADLVVAILNAVDDDLKSTTTTVRLPRLEDLVPLENAVRAALNAGWEVLVSADHGHTWHRDRQLRRGLRIPGGGERFAPVPCGAGLPPDALLTRDPHIVRVQEGEAAESGGAVALLTAVGTYFGRLPRRGYHGGAALEEVVVPCAFLTYQVPPASAETGPASS